MQLYLYDTWLHSYILACQCSGFHKLPGTYQLYHLWVLGELGQSFCWPGLFSHWSDWMAAEGVARGGGVLLCDNVNALEP